MLVQASKVWRFFFFGDPKLAYIFTGVVAGTNLSRDRLFFLWFSETRGVLTGEVSREFQCNDQQGSVSEVQACSGG